MALVVIWLICAGIGYAIGQSKGRAGEGLALGLLLGFIGIIIIAVMRPAQTVQSQAYVAPPQAQMYTRPVTNYPPGYGSQPSMLPDTPYAHEHHAPAPAPAWNQAPVTASDHFTQLKELRDAGALTDDEFAAATRRLGAQGQ